MCRVRNGNGSNKCESFAPFAVLLQPPATFILASQTLRFHLHHGLVFSLISELGISIQKVSFNVKAEISLQTPHTFLLSHSEASEEGAFSMHCQ